MSELESFGSRSKPGTSLMNTSRSACNAIALNGNFFNTQRMVGEYFQNAYFPGGGVVQSLSSVAIG